MVTAVCVVLPPTVATTVILPDGYRAPACPSTATVTLSLVPCLAVVFDSVSVVVVAALVTVRVDVTVSLAGIIEVPSYLALTVCLPTDNFGDNMNEPLPAPSIGTDTCVNPAVTVAVPSVAPLTVTVPEALVPYATVPCARCNTIVGGTSMVIG